MNRDRGMGIQDTFNILRWNVTGLGDKKNELRK
jgi:hypothetical protein